MRRVTWGAAWLVAAAGFGGVGVLHAQVDRRGADFWVGMGRFVAVGSPETGDPPDLSGTWQANGSNPGDTSRTYATTVTMKRKKVLKTPQGGRIGVYEVRWEMDAPVKGMGLLIGKRLYVAYGNRDIVIGVGAPLVFTEAEAQAYAAALRLRDQAREKDKNYDDNTSYFVKGTPWFAATKMGKYGDRFHGLKGSPTPTFYYLWLEAQGAYGHDFLYGMPKWGEAGLFLLYGYTLDKENEACDGLHCAYSGKFQVGPSGDNHSVRIVAGLGDRYQVSGTAHELPDGTVAWVVGGDDTGGAAWYDVVDGKLSGTYWVRRGTQIGRETLTPDAQVVAKNPGLFAMR